jgi:glucose-1-phosphate adenylyltransferase
MGIYLWNRELLVNLLENTTHDDFGKDIFPMAIRQHHVQTHLFDGYWEDIGTIRAFYDANLALAQADPPFRFADPAAPIFTRPRFLPSTRMGSCTIRDSLIADGCLIGSSTVLEKCVVGMRTQMGKNVTIRNTVIMGADYYKTDTSGCTADAETGPIWGIGNGAYIDGALLDKNVTIGRNARLVASEAPSPNCDFGKVMVRDGIVVVSKDASIEDNWRFPRP